MSTNKSMKSEEPRQSEERGRVLRFTPRHGRSASRSSVPPWSPVEDVGKYASPREERDDYRDRMKANAAAVLVLALLIWCGYWLFTTIAEMRKNQDCALSGRTNCVRINVPVSNR